jgi:alkylation response protein AidB-like acyl-CoA dehydrogenase
MNALVATARALTPDIMAARPEMDRLRRLPDSLAAQFRDARLYRLCIPRAHDGLEAAPSVTVETLEALAEADASAAWCVMISATTGAFGAYLDPETAAEIFLDPSLVFAGVYAPLGKATVEGDAYRVTGQWKWNSGGQNATWLCGGCVIHENGAPRMLTEKIPDHRMMLFPASEVTFIDTWHTSGLRGTGSGDMAVRDLLVPKSRSVSLITDKPRIPSPLYAFPIFGLLAIGIAAVASGNARAALKEFAAHASARRTPTGRALTDRGTIQAAYAESSARLSAARAFLFAEIDGAWRQAQTNPAISLEQRATLRLAATHMTRTAAEVVRTIQDLAGGASVFTADPLNRRVADAQTMTAHIMTAPATYELTGRALLGVPVSSAEL